MRPCLLPPLDHDDDDDDDDDGDDDNNNNIQHLYSALSKAQSALQHFVGDFARLIIYAQIAVTQFTILLERIAGFTGAPEQIHTGDNVNFPYSFRTVCGFFNVPHQYCETGPTVYRLPLTWILGVARELIVKLYPVE